MSTYQPTRPSDPRLLYTGVIVAGDASDTVGDSLLPLGTGFFVAPFLAITARHVIDEVSQQFHACRIHEIVGEMKFGIDFSIQHARHGLMKWAVMGYGYTPTIDVVALKAISAQVVLPTGSWIEWGGQFQNLQAASERLAIIRR